VSCHFDLGLWEHQDNLLRHWGMGHGTKEPLVIVAPTSPDLTMWGGV
jgi:hypothetical protein